MRERGAGEERVSREEEGVGEEWVRREEEGGRGEARSE